jgi:small conductance mechanosensitive channel
MALTALGVSLGPLLTVLGGISFVLAFALQSNLGNFASGLMLMFNKPFDVGDEVKIGELWAWVDSITLANTKLKGFGGQIYTLPNNEVWGSTIQNLTHGKNRKIVIWLRISFAQNLPELEKLAIETIKSVPGVLENPAPFTFVWNIEEYYISVNVQGWTTKEDYWNAYAETIRRLQKALDEAGIGVAAIPAHKVLLPTLEHGNSKMPKLITENLEEEKKQEPSV